MQKFIAVTRQIPGYFWWNIQDKAKDECLPKKIEKAKDELNFSNLFPSANPCSPFFFCFLYSDRSPIAEAKTVFFQAFFLVLLNFRLHWCRNLSPLPPFVAVFFAVILFFKFFLPVFVIGYSLTGEEICQICHLLWQFFAFCPPNFQIFLLQICKEIGCADFWECNTNLQKKPVFLHGRFVSKQGNSNAKTWVMKVKLDGVSQYFDEIWEIKSWVFSWF